MASGSEDEARAGGSLTVLEQRQHNNGGKTVYGRVQEKSEPCRPLLCCIDCDESLWNPSEQVSRPCALPPCYILSHPPETSSSGGRCPYRFMVCK
jgi:hypothetical protein